MSGWEVWELHNVPTVSIKKKCIIYTSLTQNHQPNHHNHQLVMINLDSTVLLYIFIMLVQFAIFILYFFHFLCDLVYNRVFRCFILLFVCYSCAGPLSLFKIVIMCKQGSPFSGPVCLFRASLLHQYNFVCICAMKVIKL